MKIEKTSYSEIEKLSGKTGLGKIDSEKIDEKYLEYVDNSWVFDNLYMALI